MNSFDDYNDDVVFFFNINFKKNEVESIRLAHLKWIEEIKNRNLEDINNDKSFTEKKTTKISWKYVGV